MANSNIPISVAYGDGIGPEIMEATLEILKAAKAPLSIQTVEVGEKVYLKNQISGIEPKTWDIIRNTKAFLKAPMTTPQGGGFKSLNVTIRAALGLYANVRPCISYSPFIETKHPKMDVIIIRENEEDLYMGIEYQVTKNTYHALKVMTRPGCEKIIHYAFQYARANRRKKVTCFTKDNILKLSDGLFHKIFDEIAPLYPEIENEHWIVDIGSAKLADTPEVFDVIVLPNLYGDILSDVAAQIAGSIGLAGSANIGEHGAMFEAIHGYAPRRAGQNIANPSGLILGAVMMLAHLELPEIATLVHNAWLKTIEDGIHTYDIFKANSSQKKVGTKEFSEAVIARLGEKPKKLKEAHYKKTAKVAHHTKKEDQKIKTTINGADIYLESHHSIKALHELISPLQNGTLTLEFIANRGAKVWPETMSETSLGDSWRCRFSSKQPVTQEDILHLLKQFNDKKLIITGFDLLRTFE